MREIVLDTETTGLDPLQGHRIIEIGCIELINKVKTGNVFHVYINPERDVPLVAYEIHGISTEFLTDKPKFEEVYEQFYNFIGDSVLVIHNAGFDMKFIRHHFDPHKVQILNVVIDTLELARKKFPGAKVNLDALCKKFKIDNSHRDKHGALLDAELLADVYIKMEGNTQAALEIANTTNQIQYTAMEIKRVNFTQRNFNIKSEEKQLHQEFMKKIKNPIW
ncbi:DNA polymerase III subunit epsilon [Rickettsiales endosymbiont of Stachyamoeba lipophora]|uniref:DNA polymerase III subunit epsilon n=1 Tax=Rickettsiales endosymbiont of Stachyamoeba lipophora TaxID=2486578 RepID=UPI000F649611|nr:DNA polymerase III subunit epsilon [Rickettsiales endosymbiont of Stachyamoeba lipophora]AZL15692.1 DNA polymerase III subunit epsilon [Rickettsiales endosymbiont of Stachyamoeba lipophora]